MTIEFQEKYQGLIAKRSRDRTVETFYSFDVPSNLAKHPNPISLAGGVPNEGFFPIESIHLNLINEPFQHLSYPKKTSNLNKVGINSKEVANPTLNEVDVSHTYRYTSNPEEVVSIARGLQYGETDGFPQLKKFGKQLTLRINKPVYENWDLILTNGSGDSLAKIADLVVEDNGTILVEEFTFTPFISSVDNYKGTVIPMKLNVRKEDGTYRGINVEYLEDLLTNWGKDENYYKGLPKPKAMYTIPTGQNPTGVAQSLEERKKIYELAEKHDIIIVEDDPYGYLVLPKFGEKNIYEEDLSNDEYLEMLYPSYLSIDKSARVLRLETFSKLFAPGLRLGFIVGNKYLINRISVHTAATTKSPSGVSQLVFNNVVAGWGGVEGWISWSKKIAKHYTIRRDVLLKTLYETESFKKGQFEIVEPDAGMFIVIYLNFEKKLPDSKNWEAVLEQLRLLSIKNGVDIIFGHKMAANLEFNLFRANFLRLTFACVDDNELLIEAGERLGNTIEEFFENIDNGSYDHLKN